MIDIDNLFKITIKKNQMKAEIWYNEENIAHIEKSVISEAELDRFLQKNNIVYGIIEENKQRLLTEKSPDAFPILIAQGKGKADGKDGKIVYEMDMSTDVDRSDGWDFREVMRIPTVKRGEKLATLIPPEKGTNGKTVTGKTIFAKAGKPYVMRVGKNVVFNDKDQSYYAVEEGQASVSGNSIRVDSVFEVPEDVSMKTGNIDFVGTIIIRGDVPTGFTIKATGDIKVFGLVEAATIIAEGSVFISEGIAGLKTGTIEAGKDVQVGYINQGIVSAGRSIFAENSILHSECTAKENIICQRGNVIGGTLTAGQLIEVKDAGNRMNTATRIAFNMGNKTELKLEQLQTEADKLVENEMKLQSLLSKFGSGRGQRSNATLLKLKYSYDKTREQLAAVKEQIQELAFKPESDEKPKLHARGTVYPNVIISFGKYERTMTKVFDHVVIALDKNDIAIIPYQN